MGSVSAWAQTSFYAEIESKSVVSPWELQKQVDGYHGTGYFYWSGGDGNRQEDKDGVVTFSFTVEDSGVYIIDFRGRRNHSGECEGAENDKCNDIFVKVDDGNWQKHMIKRMGWDTWGWDNRYHIHGVGVKTHKVSLRPGPHTIRVAGRSRGVLLDAVRVYGEGTTPPAAPTGGNESVAKNPG
jgi:hypothetical protein